MDFQYGEGLLARNLSVYGQLSAAISRYRTSSQILQDLTTGYLSTITHQLSISIFLFYTVAY